MTDLEKYALLGSLIEHLRRNGSWCGETHIQKATFLAQSVVSVPFGYEFVIYKHGPFSFDLGATLTAMRADGVLTLVPKGSYGPSYSATERMGKILSKKADLVQQFESQMNRVAILLGNKIFLSSRSLRRQYS